MRTPLSAAPVFAAIAAAVFAPAPIADNTSSSIAVLNAAVCWYAFRVLKIRSGVGRPVVAVAINSLRGWSTECAYSSYQVRVAQPFLAVLRRLQCRQEAKSPADHEVPSAIAASLHQIHCSNREPAGILPHPRSQ